MFDYILFISIYCLYLYIVYIYILYISIYCIYLYIVYIYILYISIYCLYLYVVYIYILFISIYCLYLYIVYIYIILYNTTLMSHLKVVDEVGAWRFQASLVTSTVSILNICKWDVPL